MAIARRKGHGGKLGAVVKVTWSRIEQEGMYGMHIFRYLVTLLQQDKDYGRLAELYGTKEGPTQAYKDALRQIEDKIPPMLTNYGGCEVVNQKGRVIGILRRRTETAGVVEGYDDRGVRVAIPVNAAFVNAWQEGELRFRRPTWE